MSDTRVHPTAGDATSSAATSPKHSGEHQIPAKPVPPPPATYVVQLPKEQILRYPPPENARKFKTLNRRKNNRSCCRRCFCYTLCLLILLAVAAGISAGVLYLIFRFKSPNYAVTNFAVAGINVTSAAPISPRFDVTFRAENPNGKVGIYYLRNGVINVFYNDVKMSDGVLPAFYQPRRNVTVIETTLAGSDVVLGGPVRTELRNAVSRRRVPYVVNTKVPIKVKVGSVRTWEITVKVKCNVVVDELNERASILSNKCDYSVRLW